MMTPKENLLRVIHHDNPEWVPDGMESEFWIGSPVVERPLRAGKDAFGVEWSYDPDIETGTYPAQDGHPVREFSRWREQMIIPDLDAIDWSGVRRRAEEADRDIRLVMGFVEMGIFERSYLLLGMEEALVMYQTEPDEMAELSAVVADYKIGLIERLDDIADLDIIWYGDDWGTQTNLFLRPDTWRKVIKPHTQRIYDCMKQRNIIVNQHSCGKIDSVFQDMVEMGIDLWNPCQPCNGLADLKRRFGDRVTFVGGIDSQFVLNRPGVTSAEVRVEVRKRIDDLSANGGYIAGPSHSVPYDPELIDAMHDEIRTYGRRVYQQ